MNIFPKKYAQCAMMSKLPPIPPISGKLDAPKRWTVMKYNPPDWIVDGDCDDSGFYEFIGTCVTIWAHVFVRRFSDWVKIRINERNTVV